MTFLIVWLSVFGKAEYLCSLFPIVGGAIGGFLSGLMAALNIFAMRSVKNVVSKIAIWVAMFIATLGICFVVAQVLLSVLVLVY